MSEPKQDKKLIVELNKLAPTVVIDSIGVQKKNIDGIQLNFLTCVLENAEIIQFMENSRIYITETTARDLIDHLCFHTDYYSQKEKVLEKFKVVNIQQPK